MTAYAREHKLTIAVMGCRVNGPGETDDADLGLWCGPNFVNLKRGKEELGAFGYDHDSWAAQAGAGCADCAAGFVGRELIVVGLRGLDPPYFSCAVSLARGPGDDLVEHAAQRFFVCAVPA